MVYEDPTPTRLDLPKRGEDVILDADMNPIFKGSPEEVVDMVRSYSPDYQDLVQIFRGQVTRIMTVDEYLQTMDLLSETLTDIPPLPKRPWNT